MDRFMKNNGWTRFSHRFEAYFEDVSQSFFFRNAYFGVALLALLFVFDPYFFYCAVLGSLIGYGYTIRYSTPRILKDSGLVTLNGLFLGMAMASLFKESYVVYLCVIAAALSIPMITKATYEVLQHWKLSVFVCPFILSVWAVWLCSAEFGLEIRHDIWPESIAALSPMHPGWSFLHVAVASVFHGIGRLLFLPNSVFGLFILALVTLFSPRKGLFFFIGTASATAIAYALSSTSSAWEYGFYGYSAGLVGLGLAASPEKINWKTILFFCVLSCFATMAINQFFILLRLPVLSLPYVLTMWTAALSRTPRVNTSWARTQPVPMPSFKIKESEKVA
jgi:urea transporter